jgi:hypothetical protein
MSAIVVTSGSRSTNLAITFRAPTISAEIPDSIQMARSAAPAKVLSAKCLIPATFGGKYESATSGTDKDSGKILTNGLMHSMSSITNSSASCEPIVR